MQVRKAVIPAAGLGTRFLPATKAQPKEMLPIVDKPAIQYVVEEAVRAGITDILIVTGRGKRSIEDHFDRSFELEHVLESRGKTEELRRVRAISEMASIHYIRQGEPLGLGHAVAVAEDYVGGEPFAVLLGDDLMDAESPLLAGMLAAHARTGRSVVAAMEVPREDIRFYGAIATGAAEGGLAPVRGIVEKPDPDAAPSTLAAIGRYVLAPTVFDCLRSISPGVGGELQLTDALNLLAQGDGVDAFVFAEGRYDTGNPLDYLKAVVEIAVGREDIGPRFSAFLADLVRRKHLG